MDMNVSTGTGPGMQAPATRAVRGANASELDVWLEKAEAMGELKRITAEVSSDLEAAHITYLVGLTNSPALLFENRWCHAGRSSGSAESRL